MRCQFDRDRLDAYVDESDPPAELAAVEAHLRECPACAADALARMQMKRTTRAAAASLTLTPEFRMRPELRAELETKLEKKRQPLWKNANLQWIIATGLALILFASFAAIMTRRSANNQAVVELLDLHVAALASTNPVDVVSTDRHTVKPWFQGKLPFTFNLPELQDTPYKLLGGKLVYFENSPGAELLFELRKHQISIFIVQDARDAMLLKGGIVVTNAKGFSVESWSAGGLRYTIIGDTNSSDIHALAELIRGAER